MLRGETVDPREMKEKVRKNDRSCSVSVWRSLLKVVKGMDLSKLW